MFKKFTLILLMTCWGLGASFGQITLQIPNVESCTSPVEVPVVIQETVTLASLQFTLQWDGSGLSYIGNTPPVFPSGVAFGGPVGDTLSFSWFDFGGFTLMAGDTLFKLQFNLTGSPGSSYAVEFYTGSNPSFPGTEAADPTFSSIPVIEINGSVTFGNASPTFVGCPSDITVSTTAGQCQGTATWTEPTVTDCDGNANPPTSDASPGDVFPLGTTTVTYSVTDGDGNSGTCSFDVIVEDQENPTISCPTTSISVDIPAGMSSTVVNDINLVPTTGDNCPGESLSYVLSGVTSGSGTGNANGQVFNVGTTTVSYTVTDGAGNTNTCAITVTVNQISASAINLQLIDDIIGCNDNTARVAVVLQDDADLVSLQFAVQWDGSALTYTGNTTPIFTSGTAFGQNADTLSFSWFDFSGVSLTAGDTLFSLLFTVNGTFGDCYPVDFYTGMAFPVEAAGPGFVMIPVNTIDGQVCIDDLEDPVITCPADVTIECDASTDPSNTGQATATDDCDPNPSITFADVNNLTGCSNTGSITRTWTATDASGNSSSCVQVITVEDNTDPSFDSTPSAISDVNCGDPLPTQETLTATDNCGMATVTTSQTFTEDVCNGYPVTYTWTATDVCGNSTQTSVSFNVLPDNQGPTFDSTPSALSDINCGDPFPTQETLTATDDCGMVTITTGQVFTEDICNGYQVTYTWTATDDCSNSTQTSVSFNVLADNQGPTFDSTPSPLSDINCGDPFPTQETLTATDNCGAVTITTAQVFTEDICSGYQVTYTWTATDDCSNSTQTSVSFNVLPDNQAPTFNSSPTPLPDLGCDATLPTQETLTATDNCGMVNITTDQVFSVDVCNGYQVTYTWTATDDCGNSAQTSVSFDVLPDLQAPTFDSPGTVTLECGDDPLDTGNTGVPTNIMDNCSMTTSTFSDDNGGLGTCTAGTGVITRTWTVTDDCGNSATNVQTIIIEDTTPPTFIAPGPITISCGDDPSDLSITGSPSNVMDNCSPSGNLMPTFVDVPNLTGCGGTGTIQRAWSLEDECGNMATPQVQIITVVDNDPPMAVCKDTTILLDAAGMATLNASSVDGGSSDACGNVSLSIDVSSFGCADVGPNPVVLTVTDDCGNMATCTATVTVVDARLPLINCPNDTVLTAMAGMSSLVVNDLEATASDNCGVGAINYSTTGALMTSGSGDISGTAFPLGTTVVTYTALDLSNNSISCSFTVTVNGAVAIACPSDTTVANEMGLCTAVVNDIPVTIVSGASEVDTIYYNITGATMGNGPDDASGNTFNLGESLVTYVVLANNGDSVVCSFIVTVEDVEDPTIVCPNDTTLTAAPGMTSIAVGNLDPLAADLCQLDSVGYQISGATMAADSGSVSGRVFNEGLSTVTYTAFDAAGNSASCSFEVTVLAGIAIACPNDTTVSTDPGNCSAVVNDIAVAILSGASEVDTIHYRIGGATVAEGPDDASGTDFDLGQSTVTYVVKDAAGDSVTCSFLVTVVDGEAPDLVCPNDTTVMASPGMNAATVGNLDPQVMDNCQLDSLGYELSGVTMGADTGSVSGLTFNEGVTTVTYTAFDAAGNSNSCSFTVTVTPGSPLDLLDCPNDTTVVNEFGLCSAVVNDIAPILLVPSTDLDTIFYTLSGGGSGPDDASGTTFPVGTTTVTYTVVDNMGTTDVCSFTVTVTDTEIPALSCPADTSFIIPAGSPCIVVNDLEPITSDNCAVADTSYTLSGALSGSGTGDVSGTCFPVGITIVTYVVSDPSGNNSTCSFTVNVSSSPSDLLDCPADTTLVNDPGQCGATVGGIAPLLLVAPTTITTLTYTLTGATTGTGINDASGTFFNVGTTTVTYSAQDNLGTTDACSFTVTVNDEEAPVLTCVSLDVFPNDPGMCSRVVNNNLAPNISENCNVASITYELTGATTGTGINDATGTTFFIGVTILTYTVTDDAGNSSTCEVLIAVNDTDIPTGLQCPPTVIVSPDLGMTTAVVNNIALINAGLDNCGIDSIAYTLSNATTGTGINDASGETFNLGSTTVTYEVFDAFGNSISCFFNVIVTDGTGLVECPGDPLPIDNDPGLCSASVAGIEPVVLIDPSLVDTLYFELSGATVGNGENDASGSSFNVGVTTVTYIIESGPVRDSCTFDVTIVDAEDPVWRNCPGDTVIVADSLTCMGVYSWTEPFAIDNCGVTGVTPPTEVPGDPFPLGSTTVTYSAVDAAGNTAECSFVVTVVDRSAPVIDCPDDLTVSADAGQCAAVVDWDLPNTTDCGTVTLTVSQAPMSTFAVGTTTVTYTATDAAGNSSNCSFDVTVEDNENPIFANCPPSDVNIGATNNCEAIVTWTPVTATDNCVLLPLVSTHEPGDTFPVGETTVRIVALDVNGNTTECEFVVNVPDNSAPVFSDCPDDVTLSVDAGTCEAVHSWTPPTVTDDCSNIIPVASNDPGDAFPLGQTVVTYTATDAAGNSNVCSFSVTVEDDENPTIDCPADLVLRIDGEVISDPSNVLVAASTAAGCTGLIVEFGEPTGMDNCDGSLTATQIAGPDNGGSFALGENVVTFEVEDAAGNFVDCSFSITVEDLPAVAINASPDAAGCTNSTVQLTPTIIAGASYTWTTPGGDNVNQTTLDITIGSATTGTYRVVCTTSAGCTSEGSIVIEALPEALVSIQTNAPLCDGDLELDGIVETGSAPISSWEWSGPCDFTASGQSVSIPDLTDACSGIYTLTATTDEGCTMVVNTAVDIVQVAAPVIEDDCSQVLCLGESCFLLGTDYVPSPDEYVWSASSLDAGLPEDTNENEIMVTPLAAGSYTYRYSVIIDGCQSAEDSITIRVAGAPDAEGDSLRVNFETTLENFDILENDEFDPELQGVITIESQPTRGILTSNTDGTFNYEPSSGFIGTDFFTYRLCHGCDEFQCDVATVRIEVEFDGPCVVPTMITPNDDGANDRLQILCLESGLFPNNELIIFNQWGDRVFEAAPYQNDWDGTLRGEEGRDLPDGTYFFLFKRDQESQAVKGYLTIFR